MRHKIFLFPLLILGFVLSSLDAISQCIPPAPTNIQFNQPNSFTLDVTWDPTPCAVSYVANLDNVSNASQLTQWVNPNLPMASFTVIPGDLYLFTVAAQYLDQNNNVQTSPNSSSAYYTAESIVIDLIIKMGTCSGNFTQVSNGTVPINSAYQNNNLDGGDIFMVELLSNTGESNPKYEFYFTGSKFNFTINKVDEMTYTEGLVIGGSNNFPTFDFQDFPPTVLNASNVRVTQGSGMPTPYVGYISFPSTESIQVGSWNGNFSFSGFKIYQCSEGGGGSSNGDWPKKNLLTSDRMSSSIAPIVASNPFTENLILNLKGDVGWPVTVRLFDTNGKTLVNHCILNEQEMDYRYVIPTRDILPGIYFLHLETALGDSFVRKVVKM